MMTERSTEHYTFTIVRTYPASAAHLYAAWADRDARAVWRNDPDLESDGADYELDFSVGGHEQFSGVTPDGKPYRYEGVIYDIIANARIVFGYEMYMSGERMSVSLATVEIAQLDEKSTLTFTEQGVMLDGIDIPADREGGTAWLLDNLGKYLAA